MRTRLIPLVGLISFGAIAHADEFQITWTNHGPQPLSPLFFSAGNNSFDIFQVGGTSSLGIKNIAEGGNTSAMLAIAGSAGSDVGAFGVAGGAPLGPGGTLTQTFSTDSSHGIFSFATMLGKTNDGFLGESASSMGLNLYSGGNPTGFTLNIFGSRAWDAGTEDNTQNAADLGFLGGSGNPADSNAAIRVHGGIIPNFGDSWDQMPAWQQGDLLATISVNAVPEPATLSILGLSALAVLRRRKTRS